MKQKIQSTMQLLNSGEIMDFNLGDLIIDGRRVFPLGDFARSKMPQLRGFPIKYSVASMLPTDSKGKVDVQSAFLDWLRREHKIQVVYDTANASELKGSQRELVASKVAGKLPKMLDNPDHKKFKQAYIVSNDHTLLDGHHGWASIRLVELLTDTERPMQIIKCWCPIEQLIELAQEFTATIGVAAKEGL